MTYPRRLAPAALTLAAFASAPALSSCSKDDPEPEVFGMLLTPGQERDAWSRAPEPARVVIKARIDTNTEPVTLADQTWPFDTLSTEGLTSGHYAVVSADVYDATGSVIMRGETPALLSNEGFSRELPLLVGRVGEFARPTTQISGDWPSPKTILIDGRYVLLVGEGDEKGGRAELFDLVNLRPILWDGVLPLIPSAVMTSDGANALLLSDKGALAYNFLAGTSAPVAMSAEDAAALAGGESILSDAETAEAFVVGATRAGEPTNTVLRISSDGTPTIIKLKTPRSRASAIWVKGRGLAIVGGAEGAPVEMLAAKATSFKTLVVQAPTVFEASLMATPSSDLLVVGGLDAAGAAVPPQRLSLSCAEACPPTPEGLTLPVLRGGRPFDIGQDTARLVIGADAEGFVSAQLVDASTMPAKATAVATRVQRKGSSSIAVGGGYVAIVGGTDAAGALVKDVELFTPPPF